MLRGRSRNEAAPEPAPVEAPAPAAAIDPGLAGLAITEAIGELDGTWVVYDGTDGDGRAVRLWISTPEAGRDPTLRDRLARLARLRAELDATALPLAPLAGVGEDAGRLVLARSSLAGPTLADRLAAGPLPAEEAVRLLGEVAEALDTLHAFGVPHTHLAPDGIRLSNAHPPGAILEYYGFPPPSDDESVLEVADYVAPEVARGAPAGPASDVYALACVLVTCLTGAPPFAADRPLFVLEAHRSEPPPRIADAAGLPPEIDRVLRAALDKRPEHRPATATALMDAVRRALDAAPEPAVVIAPEPELEPEPEPEREPEPAAPVVAEAPPLPPAPRPRRRVRPAVAAGVLGLCVVTGFASALTSSNTPAEPAQQGRDTAAATVAAVDTTMDRLAVARAAGRRELRAAPRRQAQAAAADHLAAAYRDAARALPPRADLAAARPAPALPGTLTAIEGAYRRLSSGATRADPAAFREAAGDVVAGERRLAATLRQLARQA